MNQNISDLSFDEVGLDFAIEEANITSDVPLESRRAIAALSVVAISMAMTIVDEDSYLEAIGSLGELPQCEEDAYFFIEFGKVMSEHIKLEFPEGYPGMLTFEARKEKLLSYF